jgi:hypothetical protein
MHIPAHERVIPNGRACTLHPPLANFPNCALVCLLQVAEALRVPCVALSPYIMPVSMPAGGARHFQRAAPRLFASLSNASADSPGGVDSRQPPEPVSWACVEHWMWPLFDAQRWGDWVSWWRQGHRCSPDPSRHCADVCE